MRKYTEELNRSFLWNDTDRMLRDHPSSSNKNEQEHLQLISWHQSRVKTIRQMGLVLAERLRLTPEYPFEKVLINGLNYQVHWISWGTRDRPNEVYWYPFKRRVTLSYGVTSDGRFVFERADQPYSRGEAAFLDLVDITVQGFRSVGGLTRYQYNMANYICVCISLIHSTTFLEHYGIKCVRRRKRETEFSLYPRYRRREMLSKLAYRLQYN